MSLTTPEIILGGLAVAVFGAFGVYVVSLISGAGWAEGTKLNNRYLGK